MTVLEFINKWCPSAIDASYNGSINTDMYLDINSLLRSDRLSELKGRASYLQKELNANFMQQRQFNKEAFIEKHGGIDIGDVVTWASGKKTRRGLVIGVWYSGTDVEGYEALLYNTNGELGNKKTRMLFGELPSLKLIAKATPGKQYTHWVE